MRGLLALVIGMGVLILVGTATLVVMIVKRADSGALVAQAPGSLRLAAGERLVAASSDGKMLTLIVNAPGGERIEVRDLESGAVVRTLSVVGGA